MDASESTLPMEDDEKKEEEKTNQVDVLNVRPMEEEEETNQVEEEEETNQVDVMNVRKNGSLVEWLLNMDASESTLPMEDG